MFEQVAGPFCVIFLVRVFALDLDCEEELCCILVSVTRCLAGVDYVHDAEKSLFVGSALLALRIPAVRCTLW